MDPNSFYAHWLLECVLVRGWTTRRCAREIDAEPEEVLSDFNSICDTLDKEAKALKKGRR